MSQKRGISVLGSFWGAKRLQIKKWKIKVPPLSLATVQNKILNMFIIPFYNLQNWLTWKYLPVLILMGVPFIGYECTDYNILREEKWKQFVGILCYCFFSLRLPPPLSHRIRLEVFGRTERNVLGSYASTSVQNTNSPFFGGHPVYIIYVDCFHSLFCIL